MTIPSENRGKIDQRFRCIIAKKNEASRTPLPFPKLFSKPRWINPRTITSSTGATTNTIEEHSKIASIGEVAVKALLMLSAPGCGPSTSSFKSDAKNDTGIIVNPIIIPNAASAKLCFQFWT
jgi:hypothetical protein